MFMSNKKNPDATNHTFEQREVLTLSLIDAKNANVFAINVFNKDPAVENF